MNVLNRYLKNIVEKIHLFDYLVLLSYTNIISLDSYNNNYFFVKKILRKS